MAGGRRILLLVLAKVQTDHYLQKFVGNIILSEWQTTVAHNTILETLNIEGFLMGTVSLWSRCARYSGNRVRVYSTNGFLFTTAFGPECLSNIHTLTVIAKTLLWRPSIQMSFYLSITFI